jgi:prevent-host-death family protein
MIHANVAELKNHLSEFLLKVESGQSIEICRRNIPMAIMMPIGDRQSANVTVLGCGRDTVRIECDLTAPALDQDHWAMLES